MTITMTKARFEKLIRFGLIGVVNTGIDVGLFTLLHSVFGVELFLANMASTTVAITGSYLMNARFTFAAKRVSHKQIGLYVAITLVGQWLLQPLVISIGLAIIAATFLNHWFSADIAVILAKLGGVAVTMIWNFALYNKFVFASKSTKLQAVQDRR